MRVARMKKSSLAMLLTVLVVSADGCGRRSGPSPGATVHVTDVRMARAVIQPLAETLEAGGVIKARTTAQLSSRIAANVRELRVQPGDRVKQGQIVAVLDDRDLAARRSQAQAALSAAQSGAVSAEAERESVMARLVLARTNHQRIEKLREKNSATPQELDRSTAELRIAEAGVRAAVARAAEASASVVAARAGSQAAEVTASFSTIAAPFNGLVTNTLLEPGNMASPGVPLLTIETTDGFRLELQIDEARVRLLDIGDAAAVELTGNEQGNALTGRVVEIARAIEPAAHAFVVKVQLPAAAGVRSGMFARARFALDERKALVVPASAIVRRGQLSLVFAIDGANRARMRAISSGARSGDSVEVLAGVQPGETVIVNPPPSLTDGAQVRAAGERP
jgi:RND family efflux transporter MFP subunit